jgi:hypothetical protein
VSGEITQKDWLHTSSYDTVEEWLLSFEEVFRHDSPPVIAIIHKLILEKVDKGSLISKCLVIVDYRHGDSPRISKVISPVMLGDLTRRVLPLIELLGLLIVYCLQMPFVGA